jgi:hypothetical protein
MIIQIDVEPKLATAYETANKEKQRRVQYFVEVVLREVLFNSPEQASSRLIELMQQISEEARANGLTEEILRGILADDSEDE